MKTSFLEQVAKALKDRNNRTRWLSIVLCLALTVSTGTFYAFMRPGQAKNRTAKVLACQFKVHEHSEECLDEDGNLICGEVSYVLHTHNDDCYDTKGNLVCRLPEVEYLSDEEQEELDRTEAGDKSEEEPDSSEAPDKSEEEPDSSEASDKSEEEPDGTEAPDKSEEEPDGTEAPDKSEEPGDTETPDKAEKPSNSETPDKSETPSDSEEPSDAEEPSDLEGADKGDVTDGSEVPEQADAADDAGASDQGETEEPSDAEEPSDSDASDKAETPSEPEEPADADTADDDGGDSDAEASAEPGEDVVVDGEDEEEEVLLPHRHGEDCYDEDGELICEREEEELLPPHEHDEDCYDEDGELVCGQVEVLEHVHGPECFITITLDEDEADYTCGKIGHTHEDVCYNEDGELICPLEEHKHSEICLLTKAGWQCGKEEHAHSEACYDEQGELVCGLEEHKHSAECAIPAQVEEPSEWLCGKDAHTHGEECYNENGELICGVEEHEHDASCLIAVEWKCGLEEHAHSEACYDEQGELVCGMEEHAHTLECLDEAAEWPCGKVAHVHGADCYDGNGALVCELEEHEHTEACLVMPELVELDDDYGYVTENGWFDIVFHVSGTVLVPKEAEDEEIDLVFTVDALNEGSEYDLFVQEGERLEEKLLGVLTVGMKNGEKDVDLTGCEITAAITPTEQLRMDAASQLMTPVEEQEGTEGASEETVLRLTAREADADANVNELDSVYLPETKKTEAPAEDPTASVDPAESVDPAAPVESADPTAPADDSVVNPEASPEAPADPIANDETTEPVDNEDSNDETTEPVDGETTIPDGDSSELVDEDTTVTGEDSNDDANLGKNQTMNFTLSNPNFAFALFSDEEETGTFTVEYYAYIKELKTSETEKDANGNVQVPTGTTALYLIDTSKDKNNHYVTNPDGTRVKAPLLPQNGVTPIMRNIYVDASGNVQYKVGRELAATAKNDSEKLTYQTQIFKDRNYPVAGYEYYQADKWDITQIPGVSGNKIHYGNPELWVYENGSLVYKGLVSELKFTSAMGDTTNGEIPIKKNQKYRLVYRSVEESNGFSNPAAFYDYDISDGHIYDTPEKARAHQEEDQLDTATQGTDMKEKTSYAYTWKQGINSDNNYEKDKNNNIIGSQFGFGNSGTNTRNGLSDETLNGVNINKANTGKTSFATNYRKCSFGLVSGLENEVIQFTEGVNAPKLFNVPSDTNVATEGKTAFEGSLSFNRDGDTYTLTASNINDTDSEGNAVSIGRSDLHKFGFVYYYPVSAKTPYIYSNEFWPMDNVSSHGTTGHDLKFGDKNLLSQRYSVGATDAGTFPEADFPQGQGQDHNAYFGMNFAVDFEMTSDYCGPLEYAFLGDDDLWVFLSDNGGETGQLICDIGGVHPAAGEYVNLKDYINLDYRKYSALSEEEIASGLYTAGSDGYAYDKYGNKVPDTKKYSLYFFYTERGASGSICWMQFTLPQLSTRPVDIDTGMVTNDLVVGKTVTSGGDEDKAFEFKVNITLPAGTNNITKFNYIRYHADGTSYDQTYTLTNGGTIELKHKEKIKIANLPQGSTYTITEAKYDSYELKLTDGDVTKDENGKDVVVIHKPAQTGTIEVDLVNRYCPEMPATGGEGPWLYSVVGTGFMVLAAGIYLVTRRVRVKAK